MAEAWNVFSMGRRPGDEDQLTEMVVWLASAVPFAGVNPERASERWEPRRATRLRPLVAEELKGDKATWRTTLDLDLIRPEDLERLLAEAEEDTRRILAAPSARPCEVCRENIFLRRRDARYCGGACRQAAYRRLLATLAGGRLSSHLL